MDRVIVECSERWELGELIGEGGFGRVFAAIGPAGRQAAVKLIPKQPGADRELLFVALDGVSNVVPIIDSGEFEGNWVLVMPRADRSLATELRTTGPLPVTEAVAILRDIANALVDLDGRVVHRDLKPDNVLYLEGVWCLSDFGIARYAEASTAAETHKFAMTWAYAAPERWRLERATSAADVYSIGVMAYELLRGERPFPGPAQEDYRDQHLHQAPPVLEEAPPALAALVDECLFKAPGSRPSPQNLLARLERASSAPPSPGAARLQEAYRAAAQQEAERKREESKARTEQERRDELAASATRSLQYISREVYDAVTQSAPGVARQGSAVGPWAVTLGGARLSWNEPRASGRFNRPGAPAFDVIAFGSVSLGAPSNRSGYAGRSHSLYFCDAQQAGEYAWFETAFMSNALSGSIPSTTPFSLNPAEAAEALGHGMALVQAAWPFTRLVPGDCEEFIDRWLDWFARASQGQLGLPGHMPERPAQGTWRMV